METKKQGNFTLVIIAVIIGVALYKDINFKELTVKRPALDLIYGFTLTALLIIIIRSKRNETEK